MMRDVARETAKKEMNIMNFIISITPLMTKKNVRRPL